MYFSCCLPIVDHRLNIVLNSPHLPLILLAVVQGKIFLSEVRWRTRCKDDCSFQTGEVQTHRGRRTLNIGHRSRRQNSRNTSGLSFNFCVTRTLLFDEKYSVVGDQRLFRARSVANVREECLLSEIIRAKNCGESH